MTVAVNGCLQTPTETKVIASHAPVRSGARADVHCRRPPARRLVDRAVDADARFVDPQAPDTTVARFDPEGRAVIEAGPLTVAPVRSLASQGKGTRPDFESNDPLDCLGPLFATRRP
ncbi:hypothetical protein [Cognatilysobacter segetis]|uniref:hypothetical protein n=1 Tax=Cognatilysobacter segetis TaxID=2492394 RepID=UPI001060D5CD|nr:hypothetical protein [Lysobacter segetis]